jgi:hypothetical protein
MKRRISSEMLEMLAKAPASRHQDGEMRESAELFFFCVLNMVFVID